LILNFKKIKTTVTTPDGRKREVVYRAYERIKLLSLDNNFIYIFVIPAIFGIGWEVLWEIFEVFSSQILVKIFPNNLTIIYYFLATLDVVVDLLQGYLGSLLGIIVIVIIIEFYNTMPSFLLWDLRSMKNKICYMLLVNCIPLLTILDHLTITIDDYTFRIGALTWIWGEVMIFLLLTAADLYVTVSDAIKKHYPTTLDILKTNSVFLLISLGFHFGWFMFLQFGFNSYLSTYIIALSYVMILCVCRIKKIWVYFTQNGLWRRIYNKFLSPIKIFPTKGRPCDLLMTTFINILIFPLWLWNLVALVAIEGTTGVYLNNVVLKNRFSFDFVLSAFFSIIPWPYVHLWLPALVSFLLGGCFLVYGFNKKKTVEGVEYREINTWPPKNITWVFLIQIVFGIFVESTWEIVEYISGEFIAIMVQHGIYPLGLTFNILHEPNDDSIGDLIQSIIGSAFIGAITYFNIFRIRRPSYLLWQFRSLLNKILYLVFLTCIGLISFIGVFNKKFENGFDIALGTLIWIWLEISIMVCMRYLDLLVVVPQEAKEFYPDRTDINQTWIHLIASALIMHFSFYFLSLFQTYTYISSYVGLCLILVYAFGVYCIRKIKI